MHIGSLLPSLSLLIALQAAALLVPRSIAAQEGTPAVAQGERQVDARHRGFNFGVGVNASFVTAGGAGGSNTGAGGALRSGYSVSRWAGLYLRGGLATMPADEARPGGYGIGFWDLGVRFRPVPGARFEPYLEGGWADQSIVENRDTYSRGNAGTLAAGLEVPVRPRLALDVGLSHTRGNIRETRRFNDAWTPLGEDAFHVASSRAAVALVWHP